MRTRALLLSLALAVLLAACSASPPESLPAGNFAAPLERLQQLAGRNTHLHTDEIRYRAGDQKLFHCSYTFGVIDARDPGKMVYLAQELKHAIPGDKRTPGCIHLAWDGDVVYTVHRGNVDNPAFLSGWDLKPDPADPTRLNPVQLPVLQEPGVSYEGIDTGNGHIYIAQRQKGLGIYRRDARGRFLRVGTSRDLNNAWGVRVRGTTAFVSDGLAGLAILDVADPRKPVLLGRVNTGGQARGLALDGSTAYVAAGSAGLVVVDVSNLQAPRVVAKVPTPGSAVRVDYASDQVFVAAWNDARVYDVSTPATPKFIGAVRMTRDISAQGLQPGAAPPPPDGRPEVTSRTLGVAAVGDVMFVGNWHQIYSYRVHRDRTAPNMLLPEEINLVDFGPVKPGESASLPVKVTNQGTAPLTVTKAGTNSANFTVTPAQLRIQPGQAAELTFTYKAASADKDTAILQVESDDPDNRLRAGYLVANQAGLGVGKALPQTTVNLVDGGQWSSTEAKGQVTLLAYFATF